MLGLGQATEDSLGIDSNLNLLSFGKFESVGSDVEGRVAVGGNAVNAFTPLGGPPQARYAGNGLKVGGTLNFSNGQIFCNTVVGGNLDLSNGVIHGDMVAGGTLNYSAATLWESTQGSQGSVALGPNFVTKQQQLTSLSHSFDALANTDAGSLSGGWFVLDTHGANLEVFDLGSANVSSNLRLDNLAANTTVIINVQGAAIDFGRNDYQNFSAGHVLFNFADAGSTSFANAGVNASFLAPLATFSGTSGHITGQVIVGSWSGNVQVNDAAFTGVTPVPEPQTDALMLAGLGVVTWFARRRRETTSRASLSIA